MKRRRVRKYIVYNSKYRAAVDKKLPGRTSDHPKGFLFTGTAAEASELLRDARFEEFDG